MARTVIATFDRPGTILDVQGQATRNGNTKYVVKFSTGEEFATFKPELAQKAASLKGQPVTCRVEQSQNGQYTNLDLADVTQGTAIGSGVPSQVVSPIPVAGAPVATAPIPVAPPPPQRDFEAEARGKVRHGQFIGAMQLVGLLYEGAAGEITDRELLDRVIAFADAGCFYAETGQSIATAGTVPQVAAPEEVPATPEAVVAQVEAVAPGVVQVGAGGLPWGSGDAA